MTSNEINDMFIMSVKYNHMEITKYLLQNGANLHFNNGYSLITAAQNDRLELVKYLISEGINVNTRNSQALIDAARNGYLEIVKLLIYRSCFPIQLETKSQSIVCAKDSLGLNIRLYTLTIAEYASYKFRQPIYQQYDVWREVAYYEYVRENILKRRQSPNFPLLYAFFLSPNNKIDFFSLKKSCLTQKDLLTKDYKKFVEIHKLKSQEPVKNMKFLPLTISDYGSNIINKLPDEIYVDLQFYSGTTLVVVTEAPHHNLYQWASRLYQKDGIVNRMISHGYHEDYVWIGILFQIISALFVMQIHGIYIRNMTISDNIYIKDVPTSGKGLGYWKFIINGIPYYLPNYGYIPMIDTNFKDIIQESRALPKTNREYKIYSSDIFGEKLDLQSVRDKVFENYRNIINTNAFTKEHTINNVMKPPETIMTMIGRMMIDNETNLGIVLSKYFRQLLNNRIGTLLRKDTEVPNIREITGQFANGEMAVEVIEDNVYKWCMVIKQKPDGFVEIISRSCTKTNEFVDRTVRVETLKQYSCTERIEQSFGRSDTNLSEENLLETYIIS